MEKARKVNLLDVVRKVYDVEEEVSPSDTGNASEEEAAGEFGPSLSGLELVGHLLAAGQGQRGSCGWVSFLEGSNSVHGQANAEDDNETSSSQGACLPSHFSVPQWAGLDEWADQEKPMGQAHLNSPQKWAHSCPVGWEVGEVPSNQGA